MSFAVVDGERSTATSRATVRAEPISAVRSETHRRADGLPVAARYVIDDELEIDVEVLGLVAVPLAGPTASASVLARGLCRYDADRRGGRPDRKWVVELARSGLGMVA